MTPKEDKIIQEITLGCLLHDIGKVLQRAENEYRNNHSNIGASYIEKLPGIKELKTVVESIKNHHQTALDASGLGSHHPAYIVCEADNIASGTDRRETDENNSKSFRRDIPLHSIFNCLESRGNHSGSDFAHHLKELDCKSQVNYPAEAAKVKAPSSVYQKIHKPLLGEISKAVSSGADGLKINNTILQILEKYCTFIPSSTDTGQIPDISLYDHSKITAAAGSAMYSYIVEEKNSDDFKKWCSVGKRDEKFFLMVSADISGIQDFIFTISSKRAMKSLRTRSFYLDVLLEHIADEILEELNLSRANLLYTGGGHFYMLLPNTGKARNAIESVREKVNNWFLERFGTGLYIAIGTCECSPAELMDKERAGASTKVFAKMAEQLSREKLRRYTPEQLRQIMNPDSSLNRKADNTRECNSCRTSAIPSGENFYDMEDEEGSDRICPICHSFYKAGKELLRKDLVLAVTDDDPLPVNFVEMPAIDGSSRYLNFTSNSELKNVKSGFRRIYTKNGSSTESFHSINLWMGDYIVDSGKSGMLTSFEEMEHKADGIRRLAAMRADVDSLGFVFSGGLDKKHATLSRYAVLSRNLSLFFKFHINRFCSGDIKGEGGESPANFKLNPIFSGNGSKPARNMAIVYSGGDDVFVVGAWNDVIEFAVDLKRAFKTYTCDKLTFSAGIGFFGHSFPVYQMARFTGDLEKQAKENPEKNSVALFGKEKTVSDRAKTETGIIHTYLWDELEDSVYEKIQFFLKYFNITGEDRKKLSVSKAFLYRLLELLETRGDKLGLNIAKLAYNLARVEQAAKDKYAGSSYNYGLLKNSIYGWASSDKEVKSLITAVNLIIYMFREPEINERKGKDE